MAQPRSVAELERLLQQAEQRAEREQQRADEAERELQEERQRAEREQHLPLNFIFLVAHW